MNPNGLVPVIEDDGFVLWESNAIVRYLARVHGAGTLWPDDAREGGVDADRWMDWQATVGDHRQCFGGLSGTWIRLGTGPSAAHPAGRRASAVEDRGR